MKYTLTSLILLVSLFAYGQSRISAEDLSNAIGSWVGSITYLDYQSGKPFTMPANLIVTQGKDGNSLVLNNIYPNEPKANGSSKIKITKEGSLLNKHEVRSREILENGNIQIQTEHIGKDDNKKALILNTYILGKDIFVISKKVQFEPDGEWIKRSEFNYARQQ